MPYSTSLYLVLLFHYKAKRTEQVNLLISGPQKQKKSWCPHPDPLFSHAALAHPLDLYIGTLSTLGHKHLEQLREYITSIFESYCHHIKKCCLFLPVHQASSIKLDHPIHTTQLQITIRKLLLLRKPFSHHGVTLKRKARSWHRGVALGSNTSSLLTQQMRGR